MYSGRIQQFAEMSPIRIVTVLAILFLLTSLLFLVVFSGSNDSSAALHQSSNISPHRNDVPTAAVLESGFHISPLHPPVFTDFLII